MKANFKNKAPITTNKETIEKAMKAELDRLYDKVGFDVAAQLLSVCCTAWKSTTAGSVKGSKPS